MLLFLKGFLIGLGKIIPGVSGSLLAIRLNVYEEMIYAVNNLFLDFKKNVYFLFKLCLGIVCAIIIGSNIILFFLEKYYIITLLIFILLILSGIPMIIKETKCYFIALISFLFYVSLLYFPKLDIINNYYFIGFLEAFTTIVPGISGTALYMPFGLHDEVLYLFSNIYLMDLKKLFPFWFGFLIGGLILIRFIDYCFKKYRAKTYGVILGLLIGSVISMIIKR